MAKNNSELQGIRKKLVAAIAMVLVACIMVVSSSYAWFTLSTAPEVKGIQTSVGSNGNLEIALRGETPLDQIGSMPSGGGNFPLANSYWGNLLDLSDSSYGMSGIALAPGRLNLTDKSTYTEMTYELTAVTEANKANYTVGGPIVIDGQTYTIKSMDAWAGADDSWSTKIRYDVQNPLFSLPTTGTGYLKVATYAADGRVSMLDSSSVETGFYNPDTQTFQRREGYGVRAIGVVSGLSDAELALRNAKNTVSSTISNVTTAAKNSIKNDAAKLANIVVLYYADQNTKFTNTEHDQITTALANLKKIAADVKVALDQSVIAVGVYQGLVVTEVTFENGAITTNGTKAGVATEIDWTKVNLVGPYASLKAAYADYADLVSALTAAETALPARVDNGEYAFTDLDDALNALINASNLKISIGDSDKLDVSTFKNTAMSYANAIIGGAAINVYMTAGIYCDIAEFVDNFEETAKLGVKGSVISSALGEGIYEFSAVIHTDATMHAKGAYLVYASNWLSGLNAVTPDGSQTAQSLSDIYGYIVDFAFRTNAANSSLLLQTAGTSRVGNNDAEVVQGAGSYMEFTIGSNGYTMAQMVKLMDAVRVVLFNDASEVVAIAKLDLTMEKVADPNTQAYDFIDSNDEAWKMTYATVSGDTVKASLYLYNFSLKADGSLEIGEKIAPDSAVITDLEQNVATGISAMVYLDGDKVENADVAISGNSMTGTMNLQFASSADLVPMQYTFEDQEKLDAPQNVAIDSEGVLTFESVTNATSYEIYVNGNPTTVEVTSGTNLKTALSSYAQADDVTLSITLVAKGTGYTNSDQSTPAASLTITGTGG